MDSAHMNDGSGGDEQTTPQFNEAGQARLPPAPHHADVATRWCPVALTHVETFARAGASAAYKNKHAVAFPHICCFAPERLFLSTAAITVQWLLEHAPMLRRAKQVTLVPHCSALPPQRLGYPVRPRTRVAAYAHPAAAQALDMWRSELERGMDVGCDIRVYPPLLASSYGCQHSKLLLYTHYAETHQRTKTTPTTTADTVESASTVEASDGKSAHIEADDNDGDNTTTRAQTPASTGSTIAPTTTTSAPSPVAEPPWMRVVVGTANMLANEICDKNQAHWVHDALAISLSARRAALWRVEVQGQGVQVLSAEDEVISAPWLNLTASPPHIQTQTALSPLVLSALHLSARALVLAVEVLEVWQSSARDETVAGDCHQHSKPRPGGNVQHAVLHPEREPPPPLRTAPPHVRALVGACTRLWRQGLADALVLSQTLLHRDLRDMLQVMGSRAAADVGAESMGGYDMLSSGAILVPTAPLAVPACLASHGLARAHAVLASTRLAAALATPGRARCDYWRGDTEVLRGRAGGNEGTTTSLKTGDAEENAAVREGSRTKETAGSQHATKFARDTASARAALALLLQPGHSSQPSPSRPTPVAQASSIGSPQAWLAGIAAALNAHWWAGADGPEEVDVPAVMAAFFKSSPGKRKAIAPAARTSKRSKRPNLGSVPLRVVWPSLKQVLQSVEGRYAGGWLLLQGRSYLTPALWLVLHRWADWGGRGRAMPHIKSYCQPAREAPTTTIEERMKATNAACAVILESLHSGLTELHHTPARNASVAATAHAGAGEMQGAASQPQELLAAQLRAASEAHGYACAVEDSAATLLAHLRQGYHQAPSIGTSASHSTNGEDTPLDWAVVTSANLSQPAWGAVKALPDHAQTAMTALEAGQSLPHSATATAEVLCALGVAAEVLGRGYWRHMDGEYHVKLRQVYWGMEGVGAGGREKLLEATRATMQAAGTSAVKAKELIGQELTDHTESEAATATTAIANVNENTQVNQKNTSTLAPAKSVTPRPPAGARRTRGLYRRSARRVTSDGTRVGDVAPPPEVAPAPASAGPATTITTKAHPSKAARAAAHDLSLPTGASALQRARAVLRAVEAEAAAMKMATTDAQDNPPTPASTAAAADGRWTAPCTAVSLDRAVERGERASREREEQRAAMKGNLSIYRRTPTHRAAPSMHLHPSELPLPAAVPTPPATSGAPPTPPRTPAHAHSATSAAAHVSLSDVGNTGANAAEAPLTSHARVAPWDPQGSTQRRHIAASLPHSNALRGGLPLLATLSLPQPEGIAPPSRPKGPQPATDTEASASLPTLLRAERLRYLNEASVDTPPHQRSTTHASPSGCSRDGLSNHSDAHAQPLPVNNPREAVAVASASMAGAAVFEQLVAIFGNPYPHELRLAVAQLSNYLETEQAPTAMSHKAPTAAGNHAAAYANRGEAVAHNEEARAASNSTRMAIASDVAVAGDTYTAAAHPLSDPPSTSLAERAEWLRTGLLSMGHFEAGVAVLPPLTAALLRACARGHMPVDAVLCDNDYVQRWREWMQTELHSSQSDYNRETRHVRGSGDMSSHSTPCVPGDTCQVLVCVPVHGGSRYARPVMPTGSRYRPRGHSRPRSHSPTPASVTAPMFTSTRVPGTLYRRVRRTPASPAPAVAPHATTTATTIDGNTQAAPSAGAPAGEMADTSVKHEVQPPAPAKASAHASFLCSHAACVHAYARLHGFTAHRVRRWLAAAQWPVTTPLPLHALPLVCAAATPDICTTMVQPHWSREASGVATRAGAVARELRLLLSGAAGAGSSTGVSSAAHSSVDLYGRVHVCVDVPLPYSLKPEPYLAACAHIPLQADSLLPSRVGLSREEGPWMNEYMGDDTEATS